MNLKRLEHLVAVAEEGSMARAARRAHLTQPALTRSIQALEAELGMTLCDRGARGVTLTAAGRMVMERAQRILFESRCLERDAALVRQHEMGDVQFGLGPYPAAIALPQVLAMLVREFPRLRVTAQVNNAVALLSALQAETLDFFVAERRTVPPTAELEVRRLGQEASGWFVRARHPLADGPVVTTAQLRQAALVSVPLPAYGHDQLRKYLGYRPAEKLHFQVECNDLHALMQLACHSDVILFAPRRAVAPACDAGALVEVEVAGATDFTMHFVMAHLAQRTVSPAAAQAMAAVAAVFDTQSTLRRRE